MTTKEAFHKLIENIEDEHLLKAYYELIKKLRSNETGSLWKSLNAAQQEELMISYEESKVLNQLMPHSEAKKQHAKWLKK